MDRDIYGRATCLDTWIDRRLVSLDLDQVWANTFSHWDSLVGTDCAAAIATATEQILRAEAEAASPSITPTSEPTNG